MRGRGGGLLLLMGSLGKGKGGPTLTLTGVPSSFCMG